jgi:integrase
MAALQTRNGSHRLLFQFADKQHTFTIGKVSTAEAVQWKAKAEHLLMRLEQRLLTLPAGVDIVTFVRHDGKPPTPAELVTDKHTALHDLREAYLKTHGHGAIEASTLRIARVHLNHLEETLGKSFLLSGLTLSRLQRHIERRQEAVSPVTIKKELDTFRSVWNWGLRMGMVSGAFPCKGLVYPKGEEKPPFMTWHQIEYRLKAGGDPETLWDCLYLTTAEIADLLTFAKAKEPDGWMFPAIVTAAHTGARRSELMRLKREDVDLEQRILTFREKKRARGTRTTRRVPVSDTVAEALRPLMDSARTYLFGDDGQPLTDWDAYKAFVRFVKGSKWQKLRGWHVLRHSFISALASKGVDQRIIDDCVGHTTEEQRRRYRHLFPDVTQAAIAKVFG